MSLTCLIDDVILLICDYLKVTEIKTLLVLYAKENSHSVTHTNNLYKLINLKHGYLISKFPIIWDFLIENEDEWNQKFPKYPVDRKLIIDEANQMNELLNDEYELRRILFHNYDYKESFKLFIISSYFKSWISPINIFAFIGIKFEIGTNDQIKMSLDIITLYENWIELFIIQIPMLLVNLLRNPNITNEIIYFVLDFILKHKNCEYYSAGNIISAITQSQHAEKVKLLEYLHENAFSL